MCCALPVDATTSADFSGCFAAAYKASLDMEDRSRELTLVSCNDVTGFQKQSSRDADLDLRHSRSSWLVVEVSSRVGDVDDGPDDGPVKIERYDWMKEETQNFSSNRKIEQAFNTKM